MFKEPVAQHMLARSTEFQSKSYIASESCFGGIVLVAVIPLPLRERIRSLGREVA
jgi:hypothetical protein